MAWVAQALLITCLAKNIRSSLVSWTIEPEGSSPGNHLNKNINPWIGLEEKGEEKNQMSNQLRVQWSDWCKTYLKASKLSLLKLHSSSTCTPETPNQEDQCQGEEKRMSDINQWEWHENISCLQNWIRLFICLKDPISRTVRANNDHNN